MHLSEVNWTAVRAYHKLIKPIAEQSAFAAQADAGFDGGEFSGPWHDKRFETECQALQDRVADRFGIDRLEFADMMWLDAHHQDACFFDALFAAAGKEPK